MVDENCLLGKRIKRKALRWTALAGGKTSPLDPAPKAATRPNRGGTGASLMCCLAAGAVDFRGKEKRAALPRRWRLQRKRQSCRPASGHPIFVEKAKPKRSRRRAPTGRKEAEAERLQAAY